MIFSANTEGGRSGRYFGRYRASRITASLWRSGALCSAQRGMSEMLFRASGTFTLRGAEPTPEDADIPTNQDASPSCRNRLTNTFTAFTISRTLESVPKSDRYLSLDRLQVQEKRFFFGLPCAKPWRFRTPLTYTQPGRPIFNRSGGTHLALIRVRVRLRYAG